MPAPRGGLAEEKKNYYRHAAALILIGAALQAWFASRGAVGGDQYVLFDLGLDYLEGGELSAVGKGMSGGGFIPGSLLQLLVGVPFSFWHDYRSPVVLIGVFHLAAIFFALPVVRGAAGDRAALAFIALWWLSPWRLYHSGILWEPAYVILPSSLHLWACWRLRKGPDTVGSAVLAATLILTFQLHGSFLFLVILTILLAAWRLIGIRWEGALLGTVIGGLTLIPTLAALVEGTLPSPAPSKSFIGFGLVTVVPLLRGFHYWFRLGSLDVGRRLSSVVFLDPEWAGGDLLKTLLYLGTALVVLLAVLSTLIAVAATWWYFFRSGRLSGRGKEWHWLRRYSLMAFASLLVSSALSPVTIQSWHALIALPAACLPVAVWLDDVWPPGKRWLHRVLLLFLFLRLPAAALIGFGHEAYRIDPDIAGKLQPRQQTLLPERLRAPEGIP